MQQLFYKLFCPLLLNAWQDAINGPEIGITRLELRYLVLRMGIIHIQKC